MKDCDGDALGFERETLGICWFGGVVERFADWCAFGCWCSGDVVADAS